MGPLLSKTLGASREIKGAPESRAAVERVVREIRARVVDPTRSVVTVWGAGTSIPSGIPGGRFLIRRMQKDLESIIDTRRAKTHLKRSHEADREIVFAKEPNLEAVLGIYSRIYMPEGLTEWLRQYIPTTHGSAHPPHYPGFAQEFASHLVNHGHLDTIISLNFDEILEWTLEEELGADGFRSVASLSEFQRIEHVKREGWAKHFGPSVKCVVLKPHGTISRGLTLRHLPKRVQFFEPVKESVLREALSNSLIVFLGFGCYNEDFLLLFGETYSRGLTGDIVIVDPEPKDIRDRLGGNRHSRSILSYTGLAEDFFTDLHDGLFLNERLGETRRPTRHRIRGLYFNLFARELRRVEASEHRAKSDHGMDEQEFRAVHDSLTRIPPVWYRERIYELELLMLLMKSGGMFVQLGAASCREVNRAYLSYRQARRDEQLALGRRGDAALFAAQIETPEVILHNILNIATGLPDDKSRAESVFAVSRVLDRYGERALNTSYCILLAPEFSDDGHGGFSATLERRFRAVAQAVAQRYCCWLEQQFHDQDADGWYRHLFGRRAPGSEAWRRLKRELPQLLADFYSDYDVDIAPRDSQALLRFTSARSLLSRTKLFQETRRILVRDRKDDWDVLRIVSVAAGWLAEYLDALAGRERRTAGPRHIRIILDIEALSTKTVNSSVSFQPDKMIHYWRVVRGITNLLDRARGLSVKIEFFGVRNLKHHMNVVSRDDDVGGGGEVYQDALYFRRTGKDIAISPVLLSDPDDIRSLVEYFDAHTHEADRVAPKSPEAAQRLFDFTSDGEGSSQIQRRIAADSPDKACIDNLVDLLERVHATA